MFGEVASAIDIYKFKDRQPDFKFQRFQETDPVLKEKVWKIRIQHPNKRIDRCNVFLDKTQLRLWDSDNDRIRTIDEGGGANFVIPNGIIHPNSPVTVKALNKKIRKVKFEDLEITKP
ncbi:MAG: hypothetical protein DA330_01780 [Nitrososphaera sp.]|nr:hypothetical protein [Nitrososphaera sp.]